MEKKLRNMKLTVIPILVGALGAVGPQRLGKEIGGVRDQRKNQDQPNHDIIKII